MALALNLTRVKALVSEGGKPKRESDGGGLYLEATASGSKLWKMAYRFGGRQKTLSFGAWPAVSLVDARAMREQAKKMLAEGQAPGAAKRALKSGGNEKTFDAWAGEYIAFRKANTRNPVAASTVDKFEWSRAAVRRQFGGTPITEIKVPEIVSAIRSIEGTGKLHKSTKAKTFVSQVFRYAAASGIAVMDPGPVMNEAVIKPPIRNHAGLTDPHKVGELLRAIDEYSGDASTRYALMMAPHVFLRDGELRALRWSWISDNERMISIPAGAMKMKREHLVPISDQVHALLREIRQFSGNCEHVFPSPRHRSRSISSNTLNSSLRRMGFSKDEVTFHGFRTTASTLLRHVPEKHRDYSDAAIELQLSHADDNKVRAAYDKAQRLEERVAMMQSWSDRIDGFRQLPPSK